MSKRVLHTLLAIVVVSAAPVLKASSICATVGDVTGQAIRNGAVQVVSLTDTKTRLSISVDANGKACTGNLPEGLYSVEAGSFGAGFLKARYYPVCVTFPDDVHLSFNLPIGEIDEGGVGEEAVLSGTLMDQGNPAEAVRMCLFGSNKPMPMACTKTNDLGQYVLIVPPGTYRLELTPFSQKARSITISLPVPGTYRNRASLNRTQ